MANKFIDDGINFGLGIFNYSKEKIEDLVQELVDRGDVNTNEAKEYVDRLIERGREEKNNLSKFVKDNIKESIDLSQYAKKDEVRSMIREELRKIFLEENK